MSTTKQYILTDGEKFYTETKELGVLGDGLKSYTSEQAAKAASRMIKKYALTPIALADAKNGKVAEMQADSEKALEEGTKQAAKETSEEVLAAKETREFAEMLQATYGHITSNTEKQEALHLYTLSPAYTRVDFSLEWLEGVISEYKAFVTDIPLPRNKKDLLDAVRVEQDKLEGFKVAFADDAETFGYVSMGVKAKLTPLQKQLSELPNENELAFTGLVVHPLACKFLSEKARQPSARGKNRNGQAWSMGEGQFLAFDYSSARTCQNGLDLGKLGLTSIQGFVYHPNHKNVEDLNIPAKKLAVVDHNHILVAQIDASQALGNVLGEAIFEIVKPDVDRVKFVQAVSSTGVDAFQSKKSAILSKTAKTVSANVIKNGQHSELETAGQNADTEKDYAIVE